MEKVLPIHCYSCGKVVPENGEYRAFCSIECWREYNKENPTPKAKVSGVKDIKQRCRLLAKAMRLEKKQPKEKGVGLFKDD